MLSRLSVFAGGWTLEAAEAVGTGQDVVAGEVLELLTSLVDKSLVANDHTDEPASRYRLLDTIRQYGLEKLLASGETALSLQPPSAAKSLRPPRHWG
jgi:predicted ATPase